MKKTRSDPGVLIGRGGAGGYQIYAKLLYDTIERVYRRAEGSDYMWVCEEFFNAILQFYSRLPKASGGVVNNTSQYYL